ncbi:MAG TPA: class I SAM-dependent methyltransferase [Kofleriaceae bacterium]|nr:class I SAM-dependent methyltransferase [Kofleriaceae bacterium]
MVEPTFQDNVEAIEAWNTVLFDKFLQFRDALTTGLARHGDAALERHPPALGARVIDLGCGFGDTTQQIARLVGPEGVAVGVDAAPRFIELGRREAEAAGIPNARFLVADVQSDDLGGPYDQAFARMGTMFFASPVMAMRNVRKAMRPGGLLSMVVWRAKKENAFMSDVENKVLELIPHHDKGDQVTCGPGPFSMASPDLVSAQLLAAGWERIGFERFDADMRIAADLDEAIAFAMTLGPAGEILRLAGDEGAKKRDQVVAALRELLAPAVRPDGVYGGSSSWIVTARAPA